MARANKRERARGRGAPELSAAELEHLLAEYNAWAGVWNLHETSPDLPLGPRPVGFEISLGWVPRRVYVKGTAPQRARDERGILPALPLPPPALEDVARVSVLGLEPWHCRWAVGDPVEIGPHAPLFCGDRKLPGLPYCQVHVARAYNRPAVAELEPALVPAPARELEPAA